MEKFKALLDVIVEYIKKFYELLTNAYADLTETTTEAE